MKQELYGEQYTYIVDTTHGINQDGFIAIGTESIVYKGMKIKQGSELRFSCVLKFKPRFAFENGERIDRLKRFKEQEWKIFEKLRECRSIVKIDDVIEDLGDFVLPCEYGKRSITIRNQTFFCVVEEFIDGWNLKEYCEEEYWQLRRIKETHNGVSRKISFPEYTEEEKKRVLDRYHYDNILKYQNQITQFMMNLCEILQFVSEQELVLHLDIKPDNIMVTRYGKELVLIDFGRSRSIASLDGAAHSTLSAVDYRLLESSENEDEERRKEREEQRKQTQFQYGTQGYAAPECYCDAVEGSVFPFRGSFEKGIMSIESDIFSFGATFWECLNVFELATQTTEFSADPAAFYLHYFMDDGVYFGRDLSGTSVYYHEKLDAILRKCMRRRNGDYRDSKNTDYYHTYGEIKKELDITINSTPTIIREENTRVRRAFKLGGGLLGAFIVFLGIFIAYQKNAYRVAQEKWRMLDTEYYNDTQFYRMESVARELMDSATAARKSDVYDSIAKFTYQNTGSTDISEYETALLVEFLKTGDVNVTADRVDEIMKNADSLKLKEISIEVVKLGEVPNSTGSRLAQAIYDVDVATAEKDSVQRRIAAYDTLMELKDEREFHNAIIKLRNALDKDLYCGQIAESKGCDKSEIRASLQDIKN
ncbi:MAG: protein kinase [Oscillospiraceae bacterium]|nr:protein kinase [Oscillospiraceae bacterium]